MPHLITLDESRDHCPHYAYRPTDECGARRLRKQHPPILRDREPRVEALDAGLDISRLHAL